MDKYGTHLPLVYTLIALWVVYLTVFKCMTHLYYVMMVVSMNNKKIPFVTQHSISFFSSENTIFPSIVKPTCGYCNQVKGSLVLLFGY